MKKDDSAQLLLVTCVLLAISIFTLAEISSSGIYMETNDPYENYNTDIVVLETRDSIVYHLEACFADENLSTVPDVSAFIQGMFNQTRDLFSGIHARHGELLHLELAALEETSSGVYRLELEISLTISKEKAKLQHELWLVE